MSSSRSFGKSAATNGNAPEYEASSSSSHPSGISGSGSKTEALLAAAPRLSLGDQSFVDPPSYDDANSIRSGVTKETFDGRTPGVPTIGDDTEFEYAFQMSNSHKELVTNVLRNPGAKSTILAITRLAIGPRRTDLGIPLSFDLSATPLSANQLEVHAKATIDMPIKSIKISMLDILDDDPDLQFGIIDWKSKPHTTGGGFPEIMFEKAFRMPPIILTFLTNFTWKANSFRRIRANSLSTGQYGFRPSIGPVGSQILDAEAFWLAVPQDSRRFDAGSFEVVSKPMQNRSFFSGTVDYTKWKFRKNNPPKLFIGFSGLESETSKSFRFSVAVVGESHQGFSWTIRSWDELGGNSWGATVSWIAINQN